MNLSNEEKTFYEDLFLKQTQSGQPLKESNCRILLNKGVADSNISDNIWALVSNNGSRQTLKKRDFFKMLKYISAYQNGYRIEEIVLKDLPELSVPNLQKKKKKRGAEIVQESIPTESQEEAAVPLVQISEQSPDREVAKETSPLRGSFKSSQSTEGPTSDSHMSPSKNHAEEQAAAEEKTEMLVDLLEKNEHVDQSSVKEADLKSEACENFESPKTLEKAYPDVTDQMNLDNIVQPVHEEEKVAEEEKTQVVPEEELIVNDAQQEELKPEIPEEEVVEGEKGDLVQVVADEDMAGGEDKPEVLAEDEIIINDTEKEDLKEEAKQEEVIEAENNDLVQVIGDEEIVSGDEKPKVFAEPEIIISAPQEEDAHSKIHQEIMGLSSQLNQLKKAESIAKENIKSHQDDDERRSKGSVSSSRASESSRKSRLSYDSNSRSAMNLQKYREYMEQNQKIKVEIRDTITYNSGFMGYGTYTSYLIRSKYPDSDTLEAERRFSDFDWLNSYFQSHASYKGLVFPLLPEKKSIGNNDPGFIQQRKTELDRYLKEIALHKVLSQDPVLRTFLGEKGREGFQSLKERIQVSGLGLPELDWRKIKEACEYAMASVKVKLQKDSVLSDWKDSNERIYDVLRIDGMVKKLLKTLEKKQELYKTMKSINANFNVFHMKIMNRVEKESYHAIGSLSSLMVAQARNMHDESFITENLIKHLKMFRAKVDGCKKSYALLISVLQEIGTNKELNKNKQGKIFEYRSEKNVNGIALITKEIAEIEKKIEILEKETVVIKDNLDLEAETLVELFDIYLPDALNFFNIQQADQFEKVSKTWEGISQE